jgi:hypothetical protein
VGRRWQKKGFVEFPGALHQFQIRFVSGKLCRKLSGLNARMARSPDSREIVWTKNHGMGAAAGRLQIDF